MKRLPEFILGLTGAVLGMIMSIILISIILGSSIGEDFLTQQLLNIVFINGIIGLIIGTLSTISICFIERYTKVSSIILIILGIAFVLFSLVQIISTILLIIAGCMGLKRKVD